MRESDLEGKGGGLSRVHGSIFVLVELLHRSKEKGGVSPISLSQQR
jgi:hypothetical protein